MPALPSQRTVGRLARSRSPGPRRVAEQCIICHRNGELYVFCEAPCSAGVHMKCFRELAEFASKNPGSARHLTNCVACTKPYRVVPAPEPTALDVAIEEFSWREALRFAGLLALLWVEHFLLSLLFGVALLVFYEYQDELSQLMSPIAPVYHGPMRFQGDFRSGPAGLVGASIALGYYYRAVGVPAYMAARLVAAQLGNFWAAYRRELMAYRRVQVLDAQAV